MGAVQAGLWRPGRRPGHRAPDPACNPYLAFAVMLAAGLKGVEQNYPLPEPVEEDIYHMAAAERARQGIQELPGSLFEAIEELEGSALIKETLGDHIFNKFIDNKIIEWDRYRMHFSAFEVERYLPIL